MISIINICISISLSLSLSLYIYTHLLLIPLRLYCQLTVVYIISYDTRQSSDVMGVTHLIGFSASSSGFGDASVLPVNAC